MSRRVPERPHGPFRRWFFEGARAAEGETTSHKSAWWKVMCLTGVDYFSTLGYQPGIAFLAAGMLSPAATLVLILVTLFVALPIYAQVAAHSPHGQGSILMRSEEHTSELQSRLHLVCRLLLEKKKKKKT